MPATVKPDPVGVREAAERLGASRKTIWWWRDQGVMPKPDYDGINNGPAWEFGPLLEWAGDSGRLHDPDALAEFKRRFKREPGASIQGGARRKGEPVKKAAAKKAPAKKAPAKKAAAKKATAKK